MDQIRTSNRGVLAACLAAMVFHVAAAATAADSAVPPAPAKEQAGMAGKQEKAATAGDSAKDVAPPVDPVIARVADETITLRQFEAAFANAARKKFYHGQPPEAEVAALRREIADRLVDELLVFKEAQRRSVTHDAEWVRKTVAGYEAQYAASEQWQKNRERLLPGLTRFIEKQSLVVRLQQQVVDSVPAPDDKAERAYYRAHPEKFMEPEKLRLHSILLEVDPSSGKEAWEAARKEARELVQKIRDGGDFAKLASQRSADPSAAEGGDRGWMHKGVLPPKVQQVADQLTVGDISEPVTVLEGVVILRVDERQATQLRTLEEVKPRLDDLLAKDQREETWKQFVAGLRSATKVVIDESLYPPAVPLRAVDATAAR